MNRRDLERIRRENLNKLDNTCRDDRHINCVRFAKGESIKHKLAKCIAGILASEGVPIENINDFFKKDYNKPCLDIFRIGTWADAYRIKDNQDFIQEARFKKQFYNSKIHGPISPLKFEFKQRRADHWQIVLDKILEFEIDKKVKKEGAITVYI